MATPSELLDSWLSSRVETAALEWLTGKIEAAERGKAAPGFFVAFSTAPRRVGRAALALSGEELEQAAEARPGWQPAHWTVDQAARTRLVLAALSRGGSPGETLNPLFQDADLGELVSLYQALPLYPEPKTHTARAAEGIRTNMKAVFEAVALRNPYPAEELDLLAWNQLVLKCLFIGSPLYLVDGIDGRGNSALAKMLSDFAHERWAAGRPVPPELWRGVGPVADGPLLVDLERVLSTGTVRERAAVALAARHNPNAEGVLTVHGRFVDRALKEFPTWESIALAAE
jgi:hypothetical protein